MMSERTHVNNVPVERSRFRDEWISQWHRSLGYGFPAVDVDFLLIEYDRRIPIALIDYKARAPKDSDIDQTSANIQAICWMADASGLSFWWTYYRAESKQFYPRPMNELARGLIKRERWMDEDEYTRFLKHLRTVGNPVAKRSTP